MIRIVLMRGANLQKGLTLVELLVSMVVSLMVMGAIMTLYSNNKATYRLQEDLARLQENGRFALEFLTRDIRLADYWGCAQNTSVANNLNGTPQGLDFSAAITGTNNDGLTGPGAIPASDSITIAGAFGAPVAVTAQMAAPTSNITVAPHSFNNTDVVLITECSGADIFRISTAGTSNLAHAQGAAADQNSSGSLSRAYGTNAQVYRVRSVTYSVALVGGTPVLRITDPNNNNQTIIDNVENMQILYGEDTDADGAANSYVDADTVTDMANVVSVRIGLLLRTDREINDTQQPLTFSGVTVASPGDRRSRRIFTTTIALRNRAP